MSDIEKNFRTKELAYFTAKLLNKIRKETDLKMEDIVALTCPVGSIIAFSGNKIPKGFLLCDGSSISRNTYKDLFDVIGNTYGAGDGKTTFTLPNLINRFIEGSSVVGKYLSTGLPNITGGVPTMVFGDPNNWSTPSGSYEEKNSQALVYRKWTTSYYNKGTSSSSGKLIDGQFNLDASLCNSIYGASSVVQPNSLTIQYLISY